jgi:APA family basic amino acid/polyamine antiporter
MKPLTGMSTAVTMPSDSTAAATPTQLFTLGFGTIVGVGWVVALGTWIRQAGPIGTALSFAVGGAAISIVGLSYARVSRRHPGGGGEITYALSTFGPRLAFVAGSVLFFTYVSVVGFLAISAGSVMSMLIPYVAHSRVLYVVQGEPVRVGPVLIGLTGLCGLALLNLLGVYATRRFQDWVTFILISCVIAFVAAALLRGNAANLLPAFSSNRAQSDLAGFLTILGTTPFWLAGFNVVPQALQSGVAQQSSRTAGRVIIASILAAAAFKGSVTVATALCAPRADVLASAFPLSLAFTRAFASARIGQGVTIVALAGLLSSWNAVFFTSWRVLTSMRENHLIRASSSRRSRAMGAPLGPLALTFVIGLLLTLGGRPFIGPIISAGGSCFGLLFLLTCLVDWRETRAQLPAHSWYRSPTLIVAGLGVCLSATMIVLSLDITDAYRSRELPLSWILMLGLLIGTTASALRIMPSRAPR